MIKHLPNILTSLRIISAPIYFYLFFNDNRFIVFLSTLLFLLAALTDYFDGKIARKTNYETKFGAFFDPISDKILINTAFLSFYIMGVFPLWMFLIILSRDLIVTVYKNSKKIPTSILAKRKTTLQFSSIAITHIIIVFSSYDLIIDQSIKNYLFDSFFMYSIYLIVTVFTLFTLINYFLLARKY